MYIKYVDYIFCLSEEAVNFPFTGASAGDEKSLTKWQRRHIKMYKAQILEIF